MAQSFNNLDVYLEIGKKRTLAGVMEWPGWLRGGRDEAEAMQDLIDYGPRYAQIIQSAFAEFQPPPNRSVFTVVERLVGNSTTDFGAPDVAPAADMRPFAHADLARCQTLLSAYWQAFDTAVSGAAGKELREGPRGGGRNIGGIVQHVLGADQSYLAQLAWKHTQHDQQDLAEELNRTRQAILSALRAAVRGEIPARGPRGGAIWPPRFFVRRVAWHVLDHIWEIEHRIM